jgi:hypothetical protein
VTTTTLSSPVTTGSPLDKIFVVFITVRTISFAAGSAQDDEGNSGEVRQSFIVAWLVARAAYECNELVEAHEIDTPHKKKMTDIVD